MSLHSLVLEIFPSFDRLVNSVPVKTMLLDTNSALQTDMKKIGIKSKSKALHAFSTKSFFKQSNWNSKTV